MLTRFAASQLPRCRPEQDVPMSVDATGNRSGMRDSDWRCLPPELLKEVAKHFIQQAKAAQIGTVRQTCQAWRESITSAVKSIHVRSLSLSSPDLSSMLTKCTQLQLLCNLPTNQLQHAPQTLQTLSLSGTGTDFDYTHLAKLADLQSLCFLGPITLTSERFWLLGQQPKLTRLMFENVLFPRTQYGASACKLAEFSSLKRLELLNSQPLTRNGANSGHAARQFLSAMKALTTLTIDAGAVSQVLLQTLDDLPKLKVVSLCGYAEPIDVEQWVMWASPKLIQVSMFGELVVPHVEWT